MKVLMVIIFLSLPSFSSSQIGILKYEDVDHAESVNAAIDRTGVILNLSAEHSDGKGILAIKESSSERSDSIFTVVSISRFSPESMIIVNEVPTAKGFFVLTTEIDGAGQKTTFKINDWPSSNSYQTTFSRVTIGVHPNSLGFTSGTIEYKGKSQVDQSEISLVNVFYFEKG